MKTKIVYVLTSSNKDYYLEQALISVISARMHNPNATIVLVADEDTVASCNDDGLRSEFLKKFDEMVSVDCSDYPTNAKKSRHLKTSLRNIISGDFLFIDCDTLICQSLEDIDDIEADFAAVLDCHATIDDRGEDIRNYLRQVIEIKTPDERYFNSGVMYIKDNERTRKLYEIWHTDWEKHSDKGMNKDQPPLYRSLQTFGELIIQELDGSWNTQLYENGLQFIHNTKILHFFTTTLSLYHILCLEDTFKRIKDSQNIPSDIIDVIENPLSGFTHNVLLSNSNTSLHDDIKSFTALKEFYKDKPIQKSLIIFLRKLIFLINRCV